MSVSSPDLSIQSIDSLSGHCWLIFGPMFGGKTTMLRGILTRYADVGLRTLYINHSIDVRDTPGDDILSSHNSGFKGLSAKIVGLKTSQLTDIDVDSYDVIGIDEAQFFEDLNSIVRHWVLDLKKMVCVSSLQGDYKLETFGTAHLLIPIAEKILQAEAICVSCLEKSNSKFGRFNLQPANFSKRITASDDVILVGGSDSYVATCLKCHQSDE